MEKKNQKLNSILDQTKGEVHERNVELEEKTKQINNLTSHLLSSQNHTQAVQHDLLSLKKEQINLMKNLDEHKTMHNKLQDQLQQEEMKERDLEIKIKNS